MTHWFFSFTASQKEDFGQLLIKHQLPDNGHPFIWQLLNDQQKIIDEIIVQPNVRSLIHILKQESIRYEFL